MIRRGPGEGPLGRVRQRFEVAVAVEVQVGVGFKVDRAGSPE